MGEPAAWEYATGSTRPVWEYMGFHDPPNLSKFIVDLYRFSAIFPFANCSIFTFLSSSAVYDA